MSTNNSTLLFQNFASSSLPFISHTLFELLILGFLETLAQLTTVGKYSQHEFEHRFDEIKQMSELHMQYIIVIEDVKKQQIVASGSIVIENKFTHNISKVSCDFHFFKF
jgi:hypothetical protein